jgi:NADPH:quinone reductase-like Zn-dependent oxidoreductase
MNAIRIHRFGPPDVIALEELPQPEPDELEVLLQVQAAGVGPWDAWVRAGKSVLEQPLPLTPGSDVSGHVVALGRGVTGFQIGQAVYGVTNPRFTGAYAEYALVSAKMMATKPHSLSHLEAASVPVVACTAYQMLFEHARIAAGQRVLIHGAGGSVGAFAVQFALAAGAQVIGTDVKAGAEYAQTLGAAQVIDVQAARFEDVLDPVDVVIDTVGRDTQERSFYALKPGGTLVSSVSRPSADLARQHAVSARFILVDVNTHTLTKIAEQIDAGSLKTRVGPVLPLAEARAAHEMLEGLRLRAPGKIVLRVGDRADTTA